MRTGRPAVPPEIQRLKGDPRKKGKRKLEAETQSAQEQARTETLPPPKYEVPAYLNARAREIFRKVANDLLPPNIIRKTDLGLLARYAWEMDRWIRSVTTLGDGEGWYESDSTEGAGGVRMIRRHPAMKDALDFSASLIKLETLLGLTPLSRQSLVRGLQGLPKGMLGELVAGEPDARQGELQMEDPGEGDDSIPPRGFMAPATTTRN